MIMLFPVLCDTGLLLAADGEGGRSSSLFTLERRSSKLWLRRRCTRPCECTRGGGRRESVGEVGTERKTAPSRLPHREHTPRPAISRHCSPWVIVQHQGVVEERGCLP